MTRIDALNNCRARLPYERLIKRLTESEFLSLVHFIEANNELDHTQFEKIINRMFLDKEKPKNWVIMQELLSVANTVALGKVRHVQSRKP